MATRLSLMIDAGSIIARQLRRVLDFLSAHLSDDPTVAGACA